MGNLTRDQIEETLRAPLFMALSVARYFYEQVVQTEKEKDDERE